MSVAPYHVALVSLARTDEGHAEAEKLFEPLTGAGIEVLFDDRRDQSAGVKLKDADLRGLPVRLIVGERSLEAGGAEMSLRAVGEREIVALDEVTERVRQTLTEMFAGLPAS